MAQEEDIKLGGAVVTEADREATKEFGKRGTFTVRIPLPVQKAQIISSTSAAIGGRDVKSLRAEDYEYVRMIVTLNSVIVKKPEWWQGADMCPDDELLFDLWRFYVDAEAKFGEKLKKI